MFQMRQERRVQGTVIRGQGAQDRRQEADILAGNACPTQLSTEGYWTTWRGAENNR